MYQLVFKNHAYNIPKYSLPVRSRMDRIDAENADTAVPQEQKYRNMYDFIRDQVGEQPAAEIFGTSVFEETDLNDITIAYLGICEAYDQPVAEARKKNALGKLSKKDRKMIMAVIRNADNLQSLGRMAENDKFKRYKG